MTLVLIKFLVLPCLTRFKIQSIADIVRGICIEVAAE
jgi:hypothetical protein